MTPEDRARQALQAWREGRMGLTDALIEAICQAVGDALAPRLAAQQNAVERYHQKVEGGILCVCARCQQPFPLYADEPWPKPETEVRVTLAIRSCDSGGIYAIEIDCPRCGHSHGLM